MHQEYFTVISVQSIFQARKYSCVAGINAIEAITSAINMDLAAYRTVCCLNQEKNPHKLRKNLRILVFGFGVCSVLKVL
jgi:precorrin-2 methylase